MFLETEITMRSADLKLLLLLSSQKNVLIFTGGTNTGITRSQFDNILFSKDVRSIGFSPWGCVISRELLNCNSNQLVCFKQEALAGETKWCAFQIPCEMQRSLDLLCPDYTKEGYK